MTTVVFGGGGFIGQEVIRRLAGAGQEIICADIQWPQSIEDTVECIECDVTDYGRIADIIDEHRPSNILHLAYLLTAETGEQPRWATTVNALGTANVMHASATHGVDRLLYASSIAAYGDPDDHSGRITENTDVAAVFTRFPVTLYAALKQLNEYQGRFYAAEHGMSVACVRPGVVFGPGRTSGLATWASSFISDPVRGVEGHIPLPPDQEMSMVYRDDVADLFVRLHDTDVVEHDAYNTGGHCVSVRELSELIGSELEAGVTWDEEGRPLGLVADVSHDRAAAELGYELTPLPDAIHRHASTVNGDS